MNKQENIFSQKKRQPVDTNFAMVDILELAHKDFKAVLIFMLKEIK